jgi:hypothetical protein
MHVLRARFAGRQAMLTLPVPAARADLPRHTRSLDVGFIRAGGEIVSAADAVDFFQLVDKIDGRL